MILNNKNAVRLPHHPNMFTAILFDMNGVLVDDEHLHQQAFAQIFADIGVILTDNDYKYFFLGKSDAEGIQGCCAHFKINADQRRLLESKTRLYLDLSKNGLRLYPGVLDIIQHFASHNLLLGLVTSSTRTEMNEIIGRFNLGKYFSVLVCCDDVDLAKPSPEGYLYAASLLGVTTDECIVIEDSPTGIKAANNANMACIGVAQTQTPETLACLQIQHCVNSVAELSHCLTPYYYHQHTQTSKLLVS